MNFNRRNFLRRTTMLGASLAATRAASAQQHQHPAAPTKPAEQSPQTKAPSQPETLSQPAKFQPVYAPDLAKLPYKLEDGVKVFRLVAEPVRRQFLPAASWADARMADR